ncbi:MAG: hypothetical protein HYU59_04520 [Magnetospirillum gryphiswaldense]|nr:hypothetical protein [Magnetospirillum gryphiswaldense]
MAAVLATLALLTVIVGAIAQPLGGGTGAGLAASAALLFYLMLEGWRCRLQGRVILVLAMAAAAATLIWHPDPSAILGKAAIAAASIIGLFAALGFLREAAETSALVQQCGELMVRQPPGRRYLVLTLGSHLISLVLNFGVLPLLGTMVMKGNTLEAAGGEQRIVDIRTRRMLSAMLRGFAMMTAWSPLSVSFAVTIVVVPGLDWPHLLPIQALLAGLLLGLGWYLDRRAFPPTGQALPGVGQTTDWRPAWRMTALVAAVVCTSVALAEMLGVKLVIVRDEVAMLGGAMFAGTVAAAFLSPDTIGALVDGLGLPPLLLIILLAWSIMALAQVGVSQIASVTLLGGALVHVAHPLVLASAMMGAWALSACSTVVGAAVLTVARIGGVGVKVVGRDWNGLYVVSGGVVVALWVVMLDRLVTTFG